MLEKMTDSLLYALGQKNRLKHTTDLHSHLIPAIDDGVDTLEESIAIINQLKLIGFKKIITTPHIMSHRFPNTKENIYAGYNLLKKELLKREIYIDIEVASEYYCDPHFLTLIDIKELLTFGDNHILFELPYSAKPNILKEAVLNLIEAGYKPILAHPERYGYFSREIHYRDLKEMGLYFQINLNSTQGFYGKRVQKAVEKIINLGMVDFIGSDIHSQRYMDTFFKALKSKKYTEVIHNNTIKNNYL